MSPNIKTNSFKEEKKKEDPNILSNLIK